MLRTSNLELKNFVIRHFSVDAVSVDELPDSPDMSIQIAFMEPRPEPQIFGVQLRLNGEVGRDVNGHCCVLKIEYTVEGIFELNESVPTVDYPKYFPMSCVLAMLGTARGALASMTAMCHGGPYFMPLLDASKQLQSQLEAEESEAKTPAVE